MLRFLALLSVVGPMAWAGRAAAQCDDNACLTVSTSPSTITAPKSVLLDTVLSSLLDASVDLSAADYEVLAAAEISLGDLLDELGATLVLGTPQAVLDANITLAQLLDAAASVATDDSNPILSAALSLAAGEAVTATGTIQLGDLLDLDLRAEVLDVCSISALGLLTSASSLYNVEHALDVQDIAVQGSALGLGALIQGLELGVVATQPPTYACGDQGSSLSSSGLRVRTSIDLVDTGTNLTVAGLAAARLNLLELDLVTQIAPGGGTLDLIDAVAGTLTVGATPGIASVYLGNVSDAVLLDDEPIDPNLDLTPATIGSVNVTLIGGIVQAAASVTARAAAHGPAAGQTALAFSAPFPTALTAQTQADLGGTLADALVADLELNVGTLMPGVVLLPVVLNTLLGTVTSTLASTTGLLDTTLESVLELLLDPVLETLGTGLGEISINVCAPFPAPSGSCPEPVDDAGLDAGAGADAGEDAGADASEPEPDPEDAGSDGGDPQPPGEDAAIDDAGPTDDGGSMLEDSGLLGDGGNDAGMMAGPDSSMNGDADSSSDEAALDLQLRGGGCTIAVRAEKAGAISVWLAVLAGVLLGHRVRRLR